VRELLPVLAVTDQVTDPLPVPLAGEHVSQLVALLDAVQLQPAPAVTLTEPVLAAELGLADVDEIEYVHAAPAWVTVNVCPPISSVPVRELLPVLAVADQLTEPLPAPLAGVQVNQVVALLDAVQLQPAPAVTLTEPVLAAEPGLADVDAIEYAHAAPAWVTVNVWPPIVRVAMRELVLVLAVADQVTEPLPVPLAGEHVSQLVALLDAVQLQPAPVVTLTAPVPAAEPGFATDGEIE
jgi:hypothetical protein